MDTGSEHSHCRRTTVAPHVSYIAEALKQEEAALMRQLANVRQRLLELERLRADQLQTPVSLDRLPAALSENKK